MAPKQRCELTGHLLAVTTKHHQEDVLRLGSTAVWGAHIWSVLVLRRPGSRDAHSFLFLFLASHFGGLVSAFNCLGHTGSKNGRQWSLPGAREFSQPTSCLWNSGPAMFLCLGETLCVCMCVCTAHGIVIHSAPGVHAARSLVPRTCPFLSHELQDTRPVLYSFNCIGLMRSVI